MHRTMVEVIAFARFEHNTGAKAKAARTMVEHAERQHRQPRAVTTASIAMPMHAYRTLQQVHVYNYTHVYLYF